MAQRKMYRTHRLEYQGIEVKPRDLEVYAILQAQQGPAGWINVGPRMALSVPLTTLLRPDVTDALDRVVRERLKRLWTVEQEDGLF